MEAHMTYREYIQWLKHFELEHEERKRAIKQPSGTGTNWDQMKLNIMQHNALVNKNAVKG